MASELIAEAITDYFGERCLDYAEGCPTCEAWAEYDRLTTPVAPVSPDATGKCGELVTVEHQYWRDQTQEWLPTGFPDRYRKDGFSVRELVTRSQAVELLAAERAEKEELRQAYDRARNRARYAEQRLWQSEAELKQARADNDEKATQLSLAETSMLEMHQDLNKLEADNAALTARVQALEADLKTFQDGTADLVNEKIDAEFRAVDLEAKLVAAEKVRVAAERVVCFDWSDNDDDAVKAVSDLRAALGGKPS